jgi:biotin operon repressor
LKENGTSREGACRGLEVLARIAEPQRGGETGYTIFHAVKLLEKLCEEPMGRPKITRLLGLGESSVKTLLRRLKEAGLVVEERRGHRATPRGCTLASYLAGRVKAARLAVEEQGLRELGGWGEIALIAVAGVEPPEDLVGVYSFRDQLVIDSCKTSIIGGVNRGVYTFPGLPGDMSSGLERVARRAGVGVERGLIVLVKGEDLPKAFSSMVKILYRHLCGRPGG